MGKRRMGCAQRIPLLVLLCAFVYMVSYLARLNYSAVMVEIIASEGFSKTLASVPLTGLFITYGFGQVVSGYLGDRLRPESMVFWGLVISAGMNIAMPFAGQVWLMTILWCVNGFAQALMWPPIVKILTLHLTRESYSKNITYIGYGYSVGTILVYLLAPLILQYSDWKAVFFWAAGVALATALLWKCMVNKLENRCDSEEHIVPQSEHLQGEVPKALWGLLFLILPAILLHGILRDGITTWMPTYMSDAFHLDNSVSILTGVALPLFSIVSLALASWLYRRVIHNEALCAALFFGVCVCANGVLCVAAFKNPLLSVGMLMVANAATHGVNLMYTTMVIPHFKRMGKTSFVSGLINAFTYVGSALSTYGVAAVTEQTGWTGTMIVWLAVSLLGVLVCLAAVRLLKRVKTWG